MTDDSFQYQIRVFKVGSRVYVQEFDFDPYEITQDELNQLFKTIFYWDYNV